MQQDESATAQRQHQSILRSEVVGLVGKLLGSNSIGLRGRAEIVGSPLSPKLAPPPSAIHKPEPVLGPGPALREPRCIDVLKRQRQMAMLETSIGSSRRCSDPRVWMIVWPVESSPREALQTIFDIGLRNAPSVKTAGTRGLGHRVCALEFSNSWRARASLIRRTQPSGVLPRNILKCVWRVRGRMPAI